mgnify:FL=1
MKNKGCSSVGFYFLDKKYQKTSRSNSKGCYFENIGRLTNKL